MGPSDLLRATVLRTIGRIVESLSIPAGFDRNVGMVTSICSLAQLRLGVRKWPYPLIGHTRDNDGIPILAVNPGNLRADLMLEPLCQENRIRRAAGRPQNAGRGGNVSLVRAVVRSRWKKSRCQTKGGTGKGCGWQARDRETLPSRTLSGKASVRQKSPAHNGIAQQEFRSIAKKL
jgi:hypothetical protein